MAKGSAALALLMLVALAAGSANARLAAKPIFDVPRSLPSATVGSKYTYKFCRPALTANACGGPFAKNQQNPRGGAGGPYVFTIKIGGGFQPKGLVLGLRTGTLTGTVEETVQPRTYSFVVCARDRAGSTCWPTKIVVKAGKPAFVGSWRGTYAYTTSGCGIAVTGPASLELFENTGPSFAYGARFDLEGFKIRTNSSCGVTSREDYSFGERFDVQTPTTIVGAPGWSDGWALTLDGPSTIIGTWLDSFYGRVELTLTRS